MRQEIKEHGTMVGTRMLGSRSCAAHDPMDGSSTRMTGGSSANGQAGEQPVWLDHGMGQQHRMMAGRWMLRSYVCVAHCYFCFFFKLIDVIEVKKVLEGPKGRHCLGFMARCLSLNVPLLPNDRNQFLKEKKETMNNMRIAFRLPRMEIHITLPTSKLTS
ncbi:unnamed protein product [Caenorhabditis nigoni]